MERAADSLSSSNSSGQEPRGEEDIGWKGGDKHVREGGDTGAEQQSSRATQGEMSEAGTAEERGGGGGARGVDNCCHQHIQTHMQQAVKS